jgi:hypothetical protein
MKKYILYFVPLWALITAGIWLFEDGSTMYWICVVIGGGGFALGILALLVIAWVNVFKND